MAITPRTGSRCAAGSEATRTENAAPRDQPARTGRTVVAPRPSAVRAFAESRRYSPASCAALTSAPRGRSILRNARELKPTATYPARPIWRNISTASPNQPPSPLAYSTITSPAAGIGGAATWSSSDLPCNRTVVENSRTVGAASVRGRASEAQADARSSAAETGSHGGGHRPRPRVSGANDDLIGSGDALIGRRYTHRPRGNGRHHARRRDGRISRIRRTTRRPVT